MNVTPKTYERKPFTVQAVQVTDRNIQDVAKWCKGTVVPGERNGKQMDCIEVDVNRPINEKQTRAFPGDWVLKGSGGWKVYTSRAFNGCFVERQVSLEDLKAPAEEQLQFDNV